MEWGQPVIGPMLVGILYFGVAFFSWSIKSRLWMIVGIVLGIFCLFFAGYRDII
jgi:hypothetical protein